MKNLVKNKNIVSGIAILVLLLAIPSRTWPYEYYIALRWIVTGAASFTIWVASERGKKEWLWIMAGIAILFNPIIPVHLSKGVWIVIDLVVAGLFLASIVRIKDSLSKQNVK